MTVYIFSRSYEIGQIINDYLLSYNYLSFLFKDEESLHLSIKNLKELPDLVILDYMIFNHDFFNVYSYLRDINIKLPVIFFNDPCITASTRTIQWIYELKELIPVITDKNKQSYKELLSKLEELIEREELAPYISLMQKPKKLPAYLRKSNPILEKIKENDNDIKEFKERTNLPQNLFYLLKLLKDNKNTPISLDDIRNIYMEDGRNIKEDSLKVLISKLKKAILNDRKCKFLISNNKGLYSFIEFK